MQTPPRGERSAPSPAGGGRTLGAGPAPACRRTISRAAAAQNSLALRVALRWSHQVLAASSSLCVRSDRRARMGHEQTPRGRMTGGRGA
eukprot:366119-Chlamydomonas_euryale.AAC.37